MKNITFFLNLFINSWCLSIFDFCIFYTNLEFSVRGVLSRFSFSLASLFSWIRTNSITLIFIIISAYKIRLTDQPTNLQALRQIERQKDSEWGRQIKQRQTNREPVIFFFQLNDLNDSDEQTNYRHIQTYTDRLIDRQREQQIDRQWETEIQRNR